MLRSTVVGSMLRRSRKPQDKGIPPVAHEALTKREEAHKGFDLARAGILDLQDAGIHGANNLLDQLYAVYNPPEPRSGFGVDGPFSSEDRDVERSE